jgi:hypothetical protein
MQKQDAQFYQQQPYKQDANNMFEWVKNQLEGREVELRNILRWEDDGGLIIEVAQPKVSLLFEQTIIVNENNYYKSSQKCRPERSEGSLSRKYETFRSRRALPQSDMVF